MKGLLLDSPNTNNNLIAYANTPMMKNNSYCNNPKTKQRKNKVLRILDTLIHHTRDGNNHTTNTKN